MLSMVFLTFLKMKRVRAAIKEIEFAPKATSLEIAHELSVDYPELFPHSLDHTAKFVACLQRDLGVESPNLNAKPCKKTKPRDGVIITRGK